MFLTISLKRAALVFSLIYVVVLPTKTLAAIYSISPTKWESNRPFPFYLRSDKFGSCTTYYGLIYSIKADTLSLSFTPTTTTGCTNINPLLYYGPNYYIQGLKAGLYKVRVHILDRVICLACPPSPGDDAGTLGVSDGTTKYEWLLKERTVTMGTDPYPMQLLNNYYNNSMVGFLNTSVLIQNGGIYTSFRVMLYPSGINSMIYPPGPTFNLMPTLKPGTYPVYVNELMDCEVVGSPTCVVDRSHPVAVDTLFVIASTQIQDPRKGGLPLEGRQSPSATLRNGRLAISLPQDVGLVSSSFSTWQAELFTESGRALKAYHFESRFGGKVNLDAGIRMERGVYLLRVQAPSRKSFTMLLALE